jgi:mono/diheme cytochrome c family protein
MNRRITRFFIHAMMTFAVPLAVATLAAAYSATAQAQSNADKVARGKYIVSTAACHDCHTPWKMGPNGPAPDMTRALSGHPQDFKLPPPPKLEAPWMAAFAATNTAWAGPWGVSFTANLTPDPETGLGKWTQRNFVETIRSGRHMGRGREVLPPMPIMVYKNFTDADLEAIFAYLQSIPAISNRVPEPLPPAEAVAQAK